MAHHSANSGGITSQNAECAERFWPTAGTDQQSAQVLIANTGVNRRQFQRFGIFLQFPNLQLLSTS